MYFSLGYIGLNWAEAFDEGIVTGSRDHTDPRIPRGLQKDAFGTLYGAIVDENNGTLIQLFPIGAAFKGGVAPASGKFCSLSTIDSNRNDNAGSIAVTAIYNKPIDCKGPDQTSAQVESNIVTNDGSFVCEASAQSESKRRKRWKLPAVEVSCCRPNDAPLHEPRCGVICRKQYQGRGPGVA